MATKKSKPAKKKNAAKELERTSELYRAKLACQIGRGVLEREHPTPPGVFPHEYALFNLLHAVEEIAEHLRKKTPQGTNQGTLAKPVPLLATTGNKHLNHSKSTPEKRLKIP